VQVPRVPASREKLTGERVGESSSVVSARVQAARERQHTHFASHDSRVVCNADMTPADVRVREACKLDATGHRSERVIMPLPIVNSGNQLRAIAASRAIARVSRPRQTSRGLSSS
jgi:predicted ATPase with chaperone activity